MTPDERRRLLSRGTIKPVDVPGEYGISRSDVNRMMESGLVHWTKPPHWKRGRLICRASLDELLAQNIEGGWQR